MKRGAFSAKTCILSEDKTEAAASRDVYTFSMDEVEMGLDSLFRKAISGYDRNFHSWKS